ncbi:MAG: LLM class flavin-dependent oxidoreductase [Planctomycetaceae bacterium]|jgi:alkanesulfonate monooxygenase SsuD/methylene tetrahydromethanopterin reductase-like flavin-dependent oxidoreductase (luciferase family)|nr:MAG: LLM class flavin-dependent oxidoreductase [Planctomycetaceae bacterium]
MQVFGFDLLAYPERMDYLKVNGELPYPLPKRYFRPDMAVQNYREHLDAWALMEELGFDGIGFNEHHTSPYGLMTSPNLMAAAASQRTHRMKLLIYGNLLPIHNPLRLAEELSMLDCLSNGRLISGFARGIPREYVAYGVDLAESRARFEEAWEIIKRAWTEEVFSYQGKFWSYNDVAIWPRPVQQPHPPVWVPVTVSKETIEWAARENVPITPGANASLPARQDMVRYYAECLAKHGHTITPNHVVMGASVYVADSREQALKEAGTYTLYFLHTLFSHGNISNVERQMQSGYRKESDYDYIKPEHREGFLRGLQGFRQTTLADLERSERLAWGSPAQVRDSLIELAESLGAGTLMLNFNQGAMPHEMFVRNLQRFGKEVLPAVQAHAVTTVPLS